MQPSTPYYSPSYPTTTMLPSQHSTPLAHSSGPHQPHYAQPQYSPIHHSPHHHHHQQQPQQQPQPHQTQTQQHSQPHHQYVYTPSTYSQSPYLCLPSPPNPPTHSQYPMQQLHVIPSYISRPQIQIQPPPIQQLPVPQFVVSPKETPERDTFYAKLHAFRTEIGEPIQRLPTLGFKELDLWVLYKEVTKRRGIDSVIAKKQWKEVAEALQLPSSCTDSGFRLRLHYKKYLEAFERKFYQPPPTTHLKKQPKELQRACSVVSTDSTITNVAGENSGSSGSRSGPGSSSDSMSKRIPKKKRRCPSVASQGDKSGPELKRRQVVTKNIKSERKDGNESSEETVTHGDEEKGETEHNLKILEAAVIAVDGARDKEIVTKKRVDFSILDNSTLKRYARAYDVNTPSRNEELAERVSTHFSQTPLPAGEHETLLQFIQAVRRAQ